MAKVYVATGQYANLLEPRIDPTGLLNTRITPTNEDANFTRGRLVDDNVGSAFRFSTAAATADVLVDLNIVPNGDFESAFVGGLPYSSGWSKSAGATVTRDTVNPQTGAGDMQVTGAITEYADVILPARSGEAWRFMFSGRGGPVVDTARIEIRNLATGSYLTSGGAWQAAAVDFLNVLGTTYGSAAASTTIQPFLTCLQDVVSIRVRFYAGVTAALYDDCFAWPGFDFMSVHGHTVTPFVVPTFRSGTTSAAGTVRATMTPLQPSFYTVLGSVVRTDRWVMLRCTNASLDASPLWIGELFIGQTTPLLRNPNYGYGEVWDDPQIRQSTPAGRQRVTSRTGGPRVGAELPFAYNSLASWQQARDEIMRRSRGGKYPIVLIPDDTDPEVCIYGRLVEGPFRSTREFMTYYTLDGSLAVAPDPMPTFLS